MHIDREEKAARAEALFREGYNCAQSVVLANENENIYAAVGVHPHDAKDFTEADIPQLTRWLTQEKKVKALGEIGLDYYYDLSPREIQKTLSLIHI